MAPVDAGAHLGLAEHRVALLGVARRADVVVEHLDLGLAQHPGRRRRPRWWRRSRSRPPGAPACRSAADVAASGTATGWMSSLASNGLVEHEDRDVVLVRLGVVVLVLLDALDVAPVAGEVDGAGHHLEVAGVDAVGAVGGGDDDVEGDQRPAARTKPSSSSTTCHGHSPGSASSPPTTACAGCGSEADSTRHRARGGGRGGARLVPRRPGPARSRQLPATRATPPRTSATKRSVSSRRDPRRSTHDSMAPLAPAIQMAATVERLLGLQTELLGRRARR